MAQVIHLQNNYHVSQKTPASFLHDISAKIYLQASGRFPLVPRVWITSFAAAAAFQSSMNVVLNKLRPSTQPSQPLPELSHFHHNTRMLAHVAMVLVGVPLFLLPYLVEMIQCYHLLHELAHELAPVTPRFCGFVLCCCVLLCWWVCFWFWCLPFFGCDFVTACSLEQMVHGIENRPYLRPNVDQCGGSHYTKNVTVN